MSEKTKDKYDKMMELEDEMLKIEGTRQIVHEQVKREILSKEK